MSGGTSRRRWSSAPGNCSRRASSTSTCATRSRLNQARQAALEAAARPRARFLGLPLAPSAAGLCAAALLGVAVWIGVPSAFRPIAAGDAAASFEDLDIIASTEESSGDTLEMLQDDADFYDWAAEKSANPDGNGTSDEQDLSLRRVGLMLSVALSTVAIAAPPPGIAGARTGAAAARAAAR